MAFAEAFAEFLRKQEEEDQARRAEKKGIYWYPSSLGFCDRKSVLEHAGIAGVPNDDRTLRVFWLGAAIHEALQKNFPFEVIGHEVEVKDEDAKVSGRIDTVARIGNYTEAVEFKSVTSKKFGYSLPVENHVLQVGSYLTFPVFLGEQRISIDRGRLVYWSKDDARVAEFIVERTPALEERVRGEFARLESLYGLYRETGRLPEPVKDEWKYRYCKYRGTGKCCGDKEEVRSDNTDPVVLPQAAPSRVRRVRSRKPKEQHEGDAGKAEGA